MYLPAGGIVHRPAYIRACGVRQLGYFAVEVFFYLVEDGLLHLLALGVE